MIKIFKTDDRVLREVDEVEPGCWIHMIKPKRSDAEDYAKDLNIDIQDMLAALDEEETSRVVLEDGYTLILVDIPSAEDRFDKRYYETIPLGILLTQDIIITVCTEETTVLNGFIQGFVREFSTKKKLRFVYQILFRIVTLYQTQLRIIDKKRIAIEDRINTNTSENELFELHALESTLVYFATSLRANDAVLDRLTRYKRLEQFPEDKELLEDVMVENKQAIEMALIYRDILNQTRELMSSVMDNNLNNAMKTLTVITILMGIPTLISGLYGMNVNSKGVPLSDSPYGFFAVCFFAWLVCMTTAIIMRKKKLF